MSNKYVGFATLKLKDVNTKMEFNCVVISFYRRTCACASYVPFKLTKEPNSKKLKQQ